LTNTVAPFTTLGSSNSHPNASPLHWAILRWTSTNTSVTPVAAVIDHRKRVTGGGGTTTTLHRNGTNVLKNVVGGNDTTGVQLRYFINLTPAEKLDLVLTPEGLGGDTSDATDSSVIHLRVDQRIPREPRQPDGSLFIPANLATVDTDADGLIDFWEAIYFTGASYLTNLTSLGDNDGDGLDNAGEFARDSNPLVADTDGDGLSDLAETKTGTFVDASNTGSDPRKSDTDGDTLSDGYEVTVSLTDPNKADTDGDGFADNIELNVGTNPNNAASSPASFATSRFVADSLTRTPGGTNGFLGQRWLPTFGLNVTTNHAYEQVSNGTNASIVALSAYSTGQIGLTNAIDFPGGTNRARVRVAWSSSFDSFFELYPGSTATNATLELVLAPRAFPSTNVYIFDDGGATGVGLVLISNRLYVGVSDATAPTQQKVAGPIDLAPLYGGTFNPDDFLNVRMVISLSNSVTATPGSLTLGVSHYRTKLTAQTNVAHTVRALWGGADTGAIGYFGGTAGGNQANQLQTLPGASATWQSFDGKVAIFAWKQALMPATIFPSAPTITSLTGVGTGTLGVTWSSTAGYTYDVQYSTNLLNGFVNVPSAANTYATSPSTSATFANPAPGSAQLFLRVAAQVKTSL
jgi:hypothetical protein